MAGLTSFGGERRAPSIFVESEQSVRDAARYQHPWRSYLSDERAAQAFGPGAESSLALGASDLGAFDLGTYRMEIAQ